MLFKNQYYYFIAGLPDFTFDSTKLPFTVEEFKQTLDEVLKNDDKRLLQNYFLKYDNENLLKLLNDKDAVLNSLGTIERDELLAQIAGAKEDLEIKSKTVPAYQSKFIRIWLNHEATNEKRHWEDLMASLYMDYGLEVKNSLMSKWFELNLNIGNVLTAIYARKYDMDVKNLIVGNNEIAQQIRENTNLRDFGLGSEFEDFETLQRISEESDIYERERKLDKFRWDWLDNHTVYDYFNIEFIFAYLCKLQILERWVSLNAEEGERIFRELIASLKNDAQIPGE